MAERITVALGGQWQIFLYQAASGRRIVREFILGLEPATQAKVERAVDLLVRHGPELGMPHSRRLTNQLFELRIRGKIDIRLFYGFIGQRIYVLHVFVKKSQRLPQRELATAQQRFRELGH